MRNMQNDAAPIRFAIAKHRPAGARFYRLYASADYTSYPPSSDPPYLAAPRVESPSGIPAGAYLIRYEDAQGHLIAQEDGQPSVIEVGEDGMASLALDRAEAASEKRWHLVEASQQEIERRQQRIVRNFVHHRQQAELVELMNQTQTQMMRSMTELYERSARNQSILLAQQEKLLQTAAERMTPPPMPKPPTDWGQVLQQGLRAFERIVVAGRKTRRRREEPGLAEARERSGGRSVVQRIAAPPPVPPPPPAPADTDEEENPWQGAAGTSDRAPSSGAPVRASAPPAASAAEAPRAVVPPERAAEKQGAASPAPTSPAAPSTSERRAADAAPTDTAAKHAASAAPLSAPAPAEASKSTPQAAPPNGTKAVKWSYATAWRTVKRVVASLDDRMVALFVSDPMQILHFLDALGEICTPPRTAKAVAC